MSRIPPESDRRAYPRISVDLPGDIRVGGRAPVTCRIRDLCQKGVRFEYPALGYDSLRQPDELVLIRFELPRKGGWTVIQTRVQVVHGARGAFGARFLHLDKGDALVLADYLKVKPPGLSGMESAGDARMAQEIAQRVSLQCLEDFVQPSLDAMQETLWTSSERAGSDAERSDLTGDIVLLERASRQRRFQEQIRKELLDPIVRAGSNAAGALFETSPEDLELVDQEGFDLWLASSVLAERLEQELAEALRPLRALGTTLFGSKSALSVEPQGLSRALRQALAMAGLGVQGQRLCLQSAGKQLPRFLETCYRRLTEAWEQAGLKAQPESLPTATPYSAPTPPPPANEAGESPIPHPPASPAPTRTPPPDRESSEWLQDLNACYQELIGAWEKAEPRVHPPHPSIAPPPAYQTQESPSPGVAAKPRTSHVVPSLARPTLSPNRLSELLLAAASTSTTAAAPVGAVRNWLRRLLPKDARGTPVQLPPVLDERVEVTDRLLTRMLGDTQLSPRIKELIQRLSLRFLAGAVSEPGFFTTPGHPLVSLIDQLEHLSMFLSRGKIRQTPAQRTLEQLMQQALITDTRNVQGLRDLSRRLAGMQQRLGGELQRSAARVAAGCEGRERVHEARRQVRTKLNETFAGRPMHPAVIDLVQRAWQSLLQLTWVREGGSGAGWRRHWETLLELHRVCIGTDQAVTMAKTAALLQAVREGLRFIGFDPYQRALLDERVAAALQAAHAGNGAAMGHVVFETLAPEPDELHPEPAPAGLTARAWTHALAEVNGLQIGAALQLREGKTELALRLVWRSGDGSELVFIDPSTLESKTLRRGALARAFHQGEARAQAPAERSLTGRAMDATLQEMQERIHYHETHDTLTGLRNHRQLMGSLAQLMSVEADAFTNHTLGFLELDRFDALTGTCGYTAGERLLVAVARLLQSQLESATCLAYLGSNRFAFLCPTPNAAAAERLGQQVCDSLEAMPFSWQGTTYPLSGSIGLVLVTKTSQDPEILLSAANTACLAAQRSGGGRMVAFREGNMDIFRHQERIRGWLQAEAVVKAERLRLRGQRIAATAGPGEIPHHYEILMSVYDEHGASLPLGDFITAAEAFNLMAEMDRLVLGKAFDWVYAHPAQARALGGIAINLSGQSLGDGRLIGLIRDGLRRLTIPPEMISFEVTETAAIVNLDRAAAIIESIKALGCHFALDDFGSGMSSYSYLKRLPVDYLKIDGSFIKDILRSPHDQAIVKSINEVAHFMGKQTIAEYVENLEILERLREIGVDYVQGYAVEKPLFLDEIGRANENG